MRPELLERALSLFPAPNSVAHPELARFGSMLRDYPQRSGKGIRSELLLTTAQAFGASASGPSGQEAAMWLATALELFQNWVLIHDDIEDDSDERRGQPALHRLYGMPLALNVGDALHAYMWEAVFKAELPAAREEFLQIVHRTAQGQHLDLAWVERQEWQLSEADYLQMIQLKTAHYTVIAPLRLGLLAAGEPLLPHQALIEEAGLALGMAFQIRDDVLNLQGEAAKYGKEIAGDLYEGKRTLINLHWLAKAPAEQKQVFLAEMQKPRQHKSAEQIAQIHQWLIESGSIDYAQHRAHQYAEQGLAALGKLLAQATQPQYAAHIMQAMQQLATREA